MAKLIVIGGLFALLAFGSALNLAKEKPIQKVIRLMKEMHTNLESEGKEDQETYDKMACWCETNEKAKTKAVADGTQRDKQLTSSIPELAATGAQLKVEIEQLTKEVKSNEEALAEATEMRAKELAAFRVEETDGVASITGLKNAVLALSKPNAALNQEVLLQVQQAISRKSDDALKKFLSVSQRRAVATMMQHRQTAGQRGPSSEIFGILKGMKESFEQNLANAQKEEGEAVTTFAQVKTAKEREIDAATTQVQNKQVVLGDTDERRANSKEDLEDTRKQVTADQEFLRDLQQRCGAMDKEFADRQKVRADEMAAVSEALKILTDDDATDLFAKSTFIQITARSESLRRSKAMKLLREAGRRLGQPRLSMLALTLKDDVFAKIKVILDDLVKKLTAEQQDDVVQRDECIDDLNTNEKSLAEKHSMKDDAAIQVEQLQLTVQKLADEMAAAQAEIDETKKEMLVASENREKENKDFQDTVTDQRATQAIVAKALDRLKAFYDKAALVQVHSSTVLRSASGQEPPPQGFGGEYKKSEGAGGVTVMMQHVIDESKQVEADAVAAEREAQGAYEQFTKDSNDSIQSLTKSIQDKQAASGKADAGRIRAEEDVKSLAGDIKGLEGLKRQLHSQCDFLLKNFEVRQASRTQEMEALEQAKSVMNGAAPQF